MSVRDLNGGLIELVNSSVTATEAVFPARIAVQMDIGNLNGVNLKGASNLMPIFAYFRC